MVKVNPAGLKRYDVELWNESLGKWPIMPVVFEETVRDSSVSYSERDCRVMIVGLMLEGELDYRCSGGVEFTAGPSGIFSIPIGAGYIFTSKGYYRKLILEFHGSLLPSLCGMLQLGHPFHAVSPEPSSVEREMREIGALIKAGREEDVPSILSKTYGFLVKLSFAAKGLQPHDMRLLAKAQSRLDDDSGGYVGISELASELGVCQSMLNKLFRKRLGISPVKYRIQRKMDRAKRLLSHTPLSIKEVALRLGYANQLYFSSDFKRACGVSPKEFRRQSSP
jgi:AraC-like DNA-binding protein